MESLTASREKNGLVFLKWNKVIMKIAIFNDTRTSEAHIGCNLVMNNLINLLKHHGFNISFTWKVGDDWTKNKDTIKDLIIAEKICGVIVNGEGTMHHSYNKSYVRNLASLAGFLKDEFDIPSFLVNATIYNNDTAFYESIKRFSLIFTRDNFSLKELSKHGLSSKAKLIPDITLKTHVDTFTSKYSISQNSQRTGIGVTDSVIKEDAALLKYLSKKNGFQFQKMVKTGAIEFRHLFRPRTLYYKLIGKFTDRKIAKFTNDPTSFINWLESKELILTARFHTVTLCILTKTPFIALESNTPKISELCKDIFGNQDRVISSLNINSDLDNLLNKYKNYSKGEIQAINKYLEKYNWSDMALAIKNNIISSKGETL